MMYSNCFDFASAARSGKTVVVIRAGAERAPDGPLLPLHPQQIASTIKAPMAFMRRSSTPTAATRLPLCDGGQRLRRAKALERRWKGRFHDSSTAFRHFRHRDFRPTGVLGRRIEFTGAA